MRHVVRIGWSIALAFCPAFAAATSYYSVPTAFAWIDAGGHAKLGPQKGGVYSTSHQFTNSGNCATNLPAIDDAISDNLPIGFAFTYGGTSFTQVRVMSNGRLQFNDNAFCGAGSPVTQQAYPDGNLGYTMRIYGADLDPSLQAEVGGSYASPCVDRNSCYVSYATIGSAPDRRFVVTWRNVPEWTNFGQADGNYNLQIVLQENGDFVYQYGAHAPGPGSVGAQIGWQVGTSDYVETAVGYPVDSSATRYSPQKPLVSNGGFEAGANSDGTYTFQPDDQGPWVFNPGSGITGANSGFTFGNSAPPEGRLAAFLQNAAAISQTGTVATAGNYMLTLRLVNRGNQGCQQSVAVRVDGSTVLAQPVPFAPVATEWMHVATPAFALAAGSHTVQIAGTATGGDCTAFVDDVQLQTAPVFNPTRIFGSFEEWQIGAQNYHYSPGAQPWTFSGNSGLVANGSAMGAPNAPQGAQAAFVQSASFMEQTWTDPGGSYDLHFAAAARTGGATVEVSIDGLSAGTFTPGVGAYSPYTVPITLGAGPHTIRFASSNGDTFVDDVQTSAPGGGIAFAGFNAFEIGTPAAATTGVIHTKVAGAAFSVDVVALNAAPASVQTGFQGSVRVEVLNASDNSGAQDAYGCRTSWSPVPSGAATSVTFVAGDAGRKTVVLSESEAWRDLRLRISTPATGTPTAVACSSDAFANRPASFAAFAATDGGWRVAGTGRSLASSAVSGGAVHAAGQPFTLHASAVDAAGTTSSRYTGTPSMAITACAGAACPAAWRTIASEDQTFSVSGTQTVRYGVDSRWVSRVFTGGGNCDNATFGDPAYLSYKSCQVGALGRLSMMPSAVAGTIDGSARYSEAGSFSLQLIDTVFSSVDAADGSSADERAIRSATIDIGRFVPDHFDLVPLAAPTLTTFGAGTCSARSFTYIGQPFGYTSVAQASVAARNASGATTRFYSGALWKLQRSDLTQAFSTPAAAPPLDVSMTTVPALTSNADGTGLLVGATADKLAFTRSGTTPVAKFAASIALTWQARDSSEAGVAGNGTIDTTTPLVFQNVAFDAGNEFRFGRLRMTPAYGSELVDLPVLVEAQYWDGQHMVTNAADQCTALPMSAVALVNYQRRLGACKTAVGSSTVTLVNGRGYAKLVKPGGGNSGSVDVSLQLGSSASGQTCATVGPAGSASAPTAANLPWLQGRWGNAAAFDQNPSTRASFGQYRSPLIYQREMY